MRDLEKECTPWRKQTDIQTDRQTDRHGDFMTESAQWGRCSEKKIYFGDICTFW